MFLEEASGLESGFVEPEVVGSRARRTGQHFAVGGQGGLRLAGLGQRGGALASSLVAPVSGGGGFVGQTGIDRGGFGEFGGIVVAKGEKRVGFLHKRGVLDLGRRIAGQNAVIERDCVGELAVAQEERCLLETRAVPQGRLALRDLVEPCEGASGAFGAHASCGGLGGKKFGQCGLLRVGRILRKTGEDRFCCGVIAGTGMQLAKFESDVGRLGRVGMGGEEFRGSLDQFLARPGAGIVRGKNGGRSERGGTRFGIRFGLRRAQDPFCGLGLSAGQSPFGQGKFGLEGVVGRGRAAGEGVESVDLSLARLGRGEEEGPSYEVGIRGIGLPQEFERLSGQVEIFGRECGEQAVGGGYGFFLRGARFVRCGGERIISAPMRTIGRERTAAQIGKTVSRSRSRFSGRYGVE